MKRITLEDLRRVVRQIIQPLARGKIDSTKGLVGKLFELLPNHSRSPEDNAADNFQTASPFGFISKPTKGVLAYFLNFLGDVQAPIIINHIHIGRPDPSAPGESITYSTNAAGDTVVCKITHFNDGRIKVEADTKIEIIAPDIEVTASTKVVVDSPVVVIKSTLVTKIDSAGRVEIDSPNIKLGPIATEFLIKGTAFKTFFDTHTHGVVPGPVPTLPMPPSNLSTTSKTQ